LLKLIELKGVIEPRSVGKSMKNNNVNKGMYYLLFELVKSNTFVGEIEKAVSEETAFII